MSDAQKSSSARRLFEIVSALKQAGKNSSRVVAYAQGFGVLAASDTAVVYSRLADMHLLIQETQEAVRSAGLKPFYLGWVEPIRAALNTNEGFANNWDGGRSQLSEAAMAILEATAERLDDIAPEPLVPDEAIVGLLKDIAALLEEVHQSDIPQALKRLVVDQLRCIQDACHAYRVRGPKGLKQALEASVGNIVLNGGLFNESKESSIITKYVGILQKLREWMPLAESTMQLATATLNLLSGESGS